MDKAAMIKLDRTDEKCRNNDRIHFRYIPEEILLKEHRLELLVKHQFAIE